MEYEWGTIDYDSEFNREWSFYGVSKWILKKYFRQVVVPTKEYSREELIKIVEDLEDLIDEDLLDKINISAMIYSAIEETSFDWILYLISKGLSKGVFSTYDLSNNCERVAAFIIREELRDAFESEMWVLFRTDETAQGKKVLEFLN